MAFTAEDRKKLERLRRESAPLQERESEALEHVENVLTGAGLTLRDYRGWSSIVQHADAIRDALAPFDSGVRCRDERV